MVYGAGLENQLGRKSLTGSNPVASARQQWEGGARMYNETMDTIKGKTLYRWEALEFAQSRKGDARNGWILIGVGVILAGIAVWLRQWTALALVVMAAVAVYLLRVSKPRVFEHTITDEGIGVGQRFYPYVQLRSFWILLNGDMRVLNVLSNKKWGLALTLQLGDADIEQVRAALTGRLAEDASRGEDIVDRFGKLL